ncbi:MAG: type VI secretion system protein TssL [Proteobacteria bacterium]|nr:MAG: type VI secretion system protein TssL [Pseudomonadota bacterium]
MAKVKCNCPPPGAPAWMATFADMMTLLMAFFVLLLSFAEVDAAKYRAVAGSMKEALGIISESKHVDVPTGIDDAQNKEDKCTPSKCEELLRKRQDEVARLYDLLKHKLEGLGSDQEFFVQRTEQEVVIRIQEQGVFPSGSDRITREFLPKIEMLRDILKDLGGRIRVTGHTDDIPIKNLRYRSNWELSSARAVSVVHELLKDSHIEPARLSAVGFGDSRPLVENKDDVSRAKNRRVDILLLPNIDAELQKLGEDGKPIDGDAEGGAAKAEGGAAKAEGGAAKAEGGAAKAEGGAPKAESTKGESP